MNPDKQWEKHVKGKNLHFETAPNTQKQLDDLRHTMANQNEKVVNGLHSIKLEMRESHMELKKDMEFLKDQTAETNGKVKKNSAWRMQYGEVLKGHIEETKREKNDKLSRYSDIAWKVGVTAAAASLGVTQLL